VFLWKNFVIVTAALSAAWLLVSLMCHARSEKRQLARLYAASLAVTLAEFTALPALATLLIVTACIAAGASARTPLIASYTVITAVVPILEVRLPGLFGLNTFMVFSVPLVAGLTVIIMRVVDRSKFQQFSLRTSDCVLMAFIVIRSFLGTRDESAQLVFRVLMEDVLSLGGAYLVASRARMDVPSAFLKPLLFVGSALALVAIFEAVRWWPQYIGVYDVKGIPIVRGMISRAGLMRSPGPFQDPLAFSIFLSITAMAGVGLLQLERRRSLVAIALLIIVLGLASTSSRTGLVALATSLAVFAFVRRKISLYALLAVAGGVGALYLGQISDMAASGTSVYRWQVFNKGLQVIIDNPLLGAAEAIKRGALKELTQGQGIVDVVNSYIGLGIQGGFLLILAFLATPVAAILSYMRYSAPRKAPERIFADVVLSQLAGTLAALVFTSLTDKNLVYFVLLSGLLLGVVRRRVTRPARPDNKPAAQGEPV
jgi:hypothetical protein